MAFSFTGGGKASGLCSLQKASGPALWRNQLMLILIKIAVAIAIGFAVVNPSFTPTAKDASCKCAADA
jgi:hypothetical protein